MGFFDLFKKAAPNGKYLDNKNTITMQYADSSTIPLDEKQYYKPDEYYTFTIGTSGTLGQRVITFEQRKELSIPSKRGLYVAEILLLHYCSLGKYPNPKGGYPGLWWFEYGIRDVGGVLRTLENRGFVYINNTTGKYTLTELGELELTENEYIPYMHKSKYKTIEGDTFGSEFNVWSINKLLDKEDKNNWRSIVEQEENKRISLLTPQDKPMSDVEAEMYKNNTLGYREKKDRIDYQNRLISMANSAVAEYNQDGNTEKLISVYEHVFIECNPPLASSQNMKLVKLYVQTGQNDKALSFLNRLENTHQAPLEKIRLEQARILKKENKYSEAMEKYALGYLAKSKWNCTFQSDVFIKDAKTTAKKLCWSEEDLKAVNERPSRKLCKPPIWCKIEAPYWRF